MKPLLVYKEFPLCHATGKTESKMHYPSGSALFIWMLRIRLEFVTSFHTIKISDKVN